MPSVSGKPKSNNIDMAELSSEVEGMPYHISLEKLNSNTHPVTGESSTRNESPFENRDKATAGQKCGTGCVCNCLQAENVNQTPRNCFHCFLVQMLLYILSLPCLFYEGIRRIFNRCPCGKPRRRLEPSLDVQKDYLDQSVSFGDSTKDLAHSDVQVCDYRKNVAMVKGLCTFEDRSEAWKSINEELTVICENGFREKLSVWLEFFNQEDQEVFASWWTHLLAKSLLAEHLEVARLWLQQFPNLSFIPLNEGPYAGMTLLHLAILQNQHSYTEGILHIFEESPEKIYRLLHQTTKHVTPSFEMVCPCAELPLNLAVWMGDENVMQTLTDSGAEMVAQDSNGNNVFHCVILLAEVNKTLALKTFDCLMSLIPVWTTKSTTCHFLKSLSRGLRLRHGKQILFLSANKEGYTPLKWAARKGQPELLDKIMNTDDVYRFHYLNCGVKFSAFYDMTEADSNLSSFDDAPAVLESAALNRTTEYLRIFEVPIVEKLFQIKRRSYRAFLVIGSLLHLLFMGVFSGVAYYTLFPRLLTVDNHTYHSYDNQTSTSLRYEIHAIDHVLLAAALFILLYWCVASWYVWFPLRRRNKIKLSEGFFLGHILILDFFLFFSLCALLYVILKACESRWEVIFFASTLSTGWCCTFLYTRLFENTAHFSIMMERVMMRDMMRFLLVMFLNIVAWSTAMMALLAVDYDLHASGHTVSSLAWSMFEVTAGVTNVQHEIEDATYIGFLSFVYFCFLLYMPIMMMNLLIAAMNHTYSEISQYAHLLCQSVQLADVIVLEAVLPSVLQSKGTDFYTKQTIPVYDKDGLLHNRQLHLLNLETVTKQERPSHRSE